MLDPDDMVCFALYSASHALQQAYRPLLAAENLTYPQYLVLSALWAEDGLTVSALGKRVLLESNTLTPLLKRLEGRGILRRQRDAKDERQVRVHVTEVGRALQSRLAEVPGCFLAQTGLGIAEAEALRDAIVALRDELRRGRSG